MAHGDHVGDLIDDFVFARGNPKADDDDRYGRYLQRRIAAVAFVPGLLVVAMLGGVTQSWVVAVAGLVVLITATTVAIALSSRRS